MSPEEKLLQKIQGLFFFAGAIAGVFQNIFLFQLGDIKTAVIYDLAALIMLLVFYILSGWTLRRFSSRTLMRVGLGVFIIGNLLFFFLREKAIYFVIPLGLLVGIGHGNFWAGNNLSQYILTRESSRSRYFGRLNFWLNIGLAAGPLLGGSIIKIARIYGAPITGYAVLFLLVAIIDLYIFTLASKLPRFSDIKFSLNHIFRHQRTTSWKLVLGQQFTFGLVDVAFSTISAILIYLIVQNEFTVGVVKMVSTLVFAVASIWAGNVLSKNKNAYIYGALVGSVGLFIFGWQQNWLGIVALIILVNVFIPILNISTSKSIYDVIDVQKESWRYKYHFLLERDIALGIGRILNYIFLLLFFTPTNQLVIAKQWVLIIPFFELLIGALQWYQYRYQRNLSGSN